MNKHRMRGVFDPISMAFVLAIIGTITSLSMDGDLNSGQEQAKASVEVTESVAMLGDE